MIYRFKKHASGVIEQLAEWVGQLDDLESLVKSLQESARLRFAMKIESFKTKFNLRRHGRRGIGTQQYRDISGVLLAYLSQGLGPSLTPEMVTGWTKFLTTMVDIVSTELDPLNVKEVKAVQDSFKLIGELGTLPDIGIGFFKL